LYISVGSGGLGLFQIGFIGYSAVLRDDFFGLFLAGLEELNRLDVRHQNFFNGFSLACEITLRRGGTDIRKFKTLLKIGGADKNPERHPFGQVYDPRRRRESCDPAGTKGRRPFRWATDLHYENLFVRLQTQPSD